MADNMTDKQFEKILKMVEMILDGCKDLDEAKAKVKELTEDQKKEKVGRIADRVQTEGRRACHQSPKLFI